MTHSIYIPFLFNSTSFIATTVPSDCDILYFTVSYRILPYICTVTASPDGNTVVSGHQDGGVRLWDPARTSQSTHTVEKLHNAHVTHLQYSPRNSYEILTLSRDNTLSILDTRNYLCSQVRTLRILYGSKHQMKFP